MRRIPAADWRFARTVAVLMLLMVAIWFVRYAGAAWLVNAIHGTQYTAIDAWLGFPAAR